MRSNSKCKIGRNEKNIYPKPKQPKKERFLIHGGESHVKLRSNLGFVKYFSFYSATTRQLKRNEEICRSANK